MQTNWTISAMDCLLQNGNLTNVVTNVHWRFKGTQVHEGVTYTAEQYGVTYVGEPNEEDFVVYEDLTEEEVVGWLALFLDISAMTQALQDNIDKQINPVVVTRVPSWNQPQGPQ